jgi:hypothetical protein
VVVVGGYAKRTRCFPRAFLQDIINLNITSRRVRTSLGRRGLLVHRFLSCSSCFVSPDVSSLHVSLSHAVRVCSYHYQFFFFFSFFPFVVVDRLDFIAYYLFLGGSLDSSYCLIPRFGPFVTWPTMASSSIKHEASSSTFEVDSDNDRYLERQTRIFKLIEAARVSITALALLCGITVLGLSADAIRVYNSTKLNGDDLLSLWPDSFDMQPAVALVVGSSLVTLASIAALLSSKVPHVSRAPLPSP